MAMINNEFWKAAAYSWSWKAKMDIQVKTGSGGQISGALLKNPWETVEDEEFVDFDEIDFDATMESMLNSGDIVFKETMGDTQEKTLPKISLDTDKFDAYFEQETLEGFKNCFKLLRDCGLPEEITQRLEEMAKRMDVLEDAVHKFKKVYQADVSVFVEDYIPEALNLTAGYIEYVNAGLAEETLISTQIEITEALDTLLIGVNDKINEIYQFASIELKAAAKALNATMNLDGYIDSKFKIK